jgi:inhibitor of cysteine peptidase
MRSLASISVIFWACLGLALVLAQCATAQKQQSPSFDNPDKLIEVTSGQEFRIVLDANPTTGFTWQLSSPLDDTLVTLVGNTYDAPATPGRVGGGGKQTWAFKAMRRGQTAIGLLYARPWEKGVDPAKKLMFTVIVR